MLKLFWLYYYEGRYGEDAGRASLNVSIDEE
jgi:hypothetical protein